MYSATYSPDDNKLRLYASSRLPTDLYERAKACGFRWAPKQELFFAVWNPTAADLCEELAGSIDDDDKTLTERAEERADRFEDYSDKRGKDAERARKAVSAIADNIPFGQPILVGHHSEKHARRDAAKIENGMRHAVKMWDTAKYWTERAAGALSHARYLERPDVRARRIKTIEADARKVQRNLDDSERQTRAWANLDGIKDRNGEARGKDWAARAVANMDHVSKCFTLAEFPRDPPASQYEGSMSLWSALEGNIITPEQAAEIAIRVHAKSIARSARWLEHYQNRLAYERAMLGESGYKEPPKKPTRAVLPLLNYSGEVTYKGYYNGEVHTTQAHPMTQAEYAAINKDYKGTKVSADGTHRLRSAMLFHPTRSVMVFLTDAKQHPRPGSGPAAEEVDARVNKAQETLTAKTKARAAVVAANKAIVKGHVHVLDATPAERIEQAEATKPAAAASDFDAMRDSLRAGVQTVSAPQLFPTPVELADRMATLADIQPGMTVLEPSGGTGRLLLAIKRAQPEADITAVEIKQHLADVIRSAYRVPTFCKDFLQCNGELGKFDRIVMNPPFGNGADIEHIRHAAKFLNPGGRLVALCAGGPRQKVALEELADVWEPLPEGTFKEAGTNVNTVLLTIEAAA